MSAAAASEAESALARNMSIPGEKRAIDIEISFGSRGPHARQALHGSFRADVGVR